jgi:hypothetical protein
MVNYPITKRAGGYVVTADDWNALIDAITHETQSHEHDGITQSLGGTGKKIKCQNLDASTGTVPVAGIPDLPASKITSGILDTARGGLGKALDLTGLVNDDLIIYSLSQDKFVRINKTDLSPGLAAGTKRFKAYLPSDQTIPAGGAGTSLQLTAEDYDPENVWDTTTLKFQPGAAGYYILQGIASIEAMADQKIFHIGMVRSGVAQLARFEWTASGNTNFKVPFGVMTYLSATDYVTLKVNNYDVVDRIAPAGRELNCLAGFRFA